MVYLPQELHRANRGSIGCQPGSVSKLSLPVRLSFIVILLAVLILVCASLLGGAGDVVALAPVPSPSLTTGPVTTPPNTLPQARWELTGPLGGYVPQLVLSPLFAADNVVWAGTESGVFKSQDAGESWLPMPGLSGRVISALVVSPAFKQDGTLFAGTAGHGLWRSRDSGESWEAVGQRAMAADAHILGLAISPRFRQDGTIYVSVGGQGILKSVDGGDTWAVVLFPPAAGVQFLALAISPTYFLDTTLFVGSSNGVFSSPGTPARPGGARR